MFEFTIIIPMYNSENYISECIESIANQYVEGFKILICDDGSTDNSVKIIENYRKNLSYIFIETLPHQGVSKTRNFGLKNSDTKAIIFMDSDDILKAGALKFIKKNYNNQDILNISNLTEKNINKTITDKSETIKSLSNMKTKNLKPSEYLAAPFGKVFNLNFLIRNNLFFNEELFIAEDMLFNMRAVLKAKFVEYINGDIYEYRFNPNSVSNRFNEKIFENELKFNALIKQYLKQKDISQDLNTVYEKLSLGGILTIFNSYILPKRVSFSEKIKILKHLCESKNIKEFY
ncbi:glycosyltransferase family 2 protein [Enterococcus bulliens]